MFNGSTIWNVGFTKIQSSVFQNIIISKTKLSCGYFQTVICASFQIFNLHGPASIWEHTKTHKVMTKLMLYKIYWKILFQKVALGYLLHFVQNGSSKNIFKHLLLHSNLKNPKVTRPGFHLGAPKNVKLRQQQINIEDMGESSSRKLRWVIYYTLYRMDHQKTH